MVWVPKLTGLPAGTTKGDLAVFDGSDWIRVGVGADDTVLTADAAQTAGVKWAAGGAGGSAVALGRPGATNDFLLKPGMAFLGTASTILHPADRLRYEPFLTPTSITVDALKLEVTTAAGSSNMRLGIYEADADWQPTALVFDSGNVATATTGVKTATISPAETLAAGRYLTVSNHSHQIAVRDYRMAPLWLTPTMGTTPFLILMSVASTFAALPDPGTAWDTESTDAAGYRGTVLLNVSNPAP